MDESERHGPLSRFKVLDLTHARGGPACARVFADWGADVIRIEQPQGNQEKDEVTGKRLSSDFQNLHRNKRSLTLNLKAPEALEVFMRLVKSADVVIENMRPSVTRRLGIDYESVRRVNPRIVYGSISGFGQEGPWANFPCLDQVAQGMTGLMSVTGQPGTGPGRIGVAVTDLFSGALMTQGLLIALLDRERTGTGTWVQGSLLEAGIALLDFQATRWLIDGQVPGQEGNFHPTAAPTGTYKTKDGYLNISAAGDRIFGKFCRAIGLAELAFDPRYSSSMNRSVNRKALNDAVGLALGTRTTQTWIDLFMSAGVPCGPVLDIKNTFEHEQVKFLEVVQDVPTDEGGSIKLVGQPFKIDGYNSKIRAPVSSLGKDNSDVLSSLGYGEDQIQSLSEKGAI